MSVDQLSIHLTTSQNGMDADWSCYVLIPRLHIIYEVYRSKIDLLPENSLTKIA